MFITFFIYQSSYLFSENTFLKHLSLVATISSLISLRIVITVFLKLFANYSFLEVFGFSPCLSFLWVSFSIVLVSLSETFPNSMFIFKSEVLNGGPWAMGQTFQGSLKLRFFSMGMPVSLECNIPISFLWSINLTVSWEPRRVGRLGVFSVHWITLSFKSLFSVHSLLLLHRFAWHSEASTPLQRLYFQFLSIWSGWERAVRPASPLVVCVCRVFVGWLVCTGWERCLGFSLFLPHTFNQTCFLLHLSPPEVPRASTSRVFPASESWFSFFLVPGLVLPGARVQFLSSGKAITHRLSIFHIPKTGWHLNSVRTSCQHSLPCGIYLWFLISFLSFWWGSGKQQK